MKNQNPKKQKSFTLIEMMVVVTVFSLMVGTIINVFMWGIREQRRALATQKLLDETSYVLEYMSRAVRMAKKQLVPTPNCSKTCLSSSGLNYETSGVSDLRFQNYDCVCQRFFLEGGQLKEQKGWELVGGNLTGGTTLAMTSSAFKINTGGLKFNLIGADQPPGDYLQPRVTIFLDIQGSGQKPEERPQIKIQTTISQRNLDIQY